MSFVDKILELLVTPQKPDDLNKHPSSIEELMKFKLNQERIETRYLNSLKSYKMLIEKQTLNFFKLNVFFSMFFNSNMLQICFEYFLTNIKNTLFKNLAIA